MKKIGIVTIFNLNNYGNRLQAYALSRVVKKLECTPIMIQYCSDIKTLIKEFFKKNYLLYSCCQFFLDFFKGNKLSAVIKKCNRIKLFATFSHRMKSKITFFDINSIDYYICGSDQIWNPNFAGQSSYFATFAPKAKRISYSASFGISKLPDNFAGRYKKNLYEMPYVSVREKAGAEIVKELTGKRAQVLVDPTLMLDADEWKAISKKPKFDVSKKYILTYFLGSFSEKTNEYVKVLAEENNLEIITLNKSKEDDYWNGTGPSEFVWLIENASLVCTDSFHASVFSVIMDTPFIVFRREETGNDMSSRFDSLLGMLKLEGRFLENIQKGDEFKKDYCHVSEILEEERKKSINFLTQALGLNVKRV